MPEAVYNSKGMSSGEIATQAEKLRHATGLSAENYIDIVKLLEFDIGKIIQGFDLIVVPDIELNGDRALTSIDPPRIFVSEFTYDSACSGDFHSRFVLAHELGHLILHKRYNNISHHSSKKTYQYNIRNAPIYHQSEWQADCFAASFLIPDALINPQNNSILISTLSGVHRRWAEKRIQWWKRDNHYVFTKKDDAFCNKK